MEVAKTVADSVLNRKGLTFSVEIARQGGKNELSAQLEVLLLTLFIDRGGNAIKCSPTFKPQTVISMMRLKERLNQWGYGGVWTTEMNYIVRLGNARQIFLSADESANVVGNTAHILLEVDESQDVSKEKYAKEFRPMGAATNVTTVHYGTTWDDSTLLVAVIPPISAPDGQSLQHGGEPAFLFWVTYRFGWGWVGIRTACLQLIPTSVVDALKHAHLSQHRILSSANHVLSFLTMCYFPLNPGGCDACPR